jgi:transposase
MSRVELFERIRRDSREHGLSIRQLADKHHVHRRTVRQALMSAAPPARKVPERGSPALGPHKATIRAWLEADRSVPAKQRHTARRVWQRLVEEHGAQVAEATVRAEVAEVRRELFAERCTVTIPQEHPAGAEAECDFGEFYAFIDGTLTKLWLFCLRLSHSGAGFHRAFTHQAQEAFLEGHVLGFEALGGVPGRVRYDNLRTAVSKVLLGRDRVENERFVILRSHYGFDSFFCLPGIGGAHEKGGVEGEVGRFRRRWLVPIPRVASVAELNERIAEADRRDLDRRIANRALTVGEMAAAERLRPLPAAPFDPSSVVGAKVDSKARVSVRQALYSVPARLAGRRVQIRLGAAEFEVIFDGRVVARHERDAHKHTEHLVLDHYLEVLVRKPGALPGSVCLAQARASGAFTDTHQRFWDEARRRLGDGAGTRALCNVLLLHRNLPAAAVTAGIDAALSAGSVDPQVVTVEARRAADRRPAAPVIPIGAAIDRPAPTLAGYDTLLTATGSDQ